jgi:hypothetical protein
MREQVDKRAVVAAGGDAVAQAGRDIREMSAEQIIELFRWYDFKDPHGHSLVQCQDFLDLVQQATA